jgi:hypothetical protein
MKSDVKATGSERDSYDAMKVMMYVKVREVLEDKRNNPDGENETRKTPRI